MNWPKIIAWSHLVGGAVGLGLLFWPYVTVPPWRWYVGSFLFFTLSVAGGVLTLRNRRWGPPLSLTVELLQLIQVNTGPFAYIYFSGLQVLLVFSNTGPGLSLGVQSEFWLGAGSPAYQWFLALDLLTLVTVPALWRRIRADAMSHSAAHATESSSAAA